MKRSIPTLAVAVAAGAATAGPTVTVFEAFNHPNGQIDPQAYGLRLDTFIGDEDPTTFSFEDGAGNSTVTLTLTVNDDDSATFEIGGIVTADSSSGTDLGAWFINATYNGSIDADGVFRSSDDSVVGEISQGTPDTSFNLDAVLLDGFSFIFGDAFAGDRLGNDVDGEFVGSGWVNTDGVENSNQTQDWLFTARVIPLPHPAALAAAGLCGLAVTRRRR